MASIDDAPAPLHQEIHQNGRLTISKDYRRQSALFVMARLIVVLASGMSGTRVSNGESTLVLRLCLDTVLRIGSDYALVPVPGVMAAHRPRVANELSRALPAAIEALADNGHAALAIDAARTARWLMNSGAISRSRLPGFAEGVRDYPYLARILRDEHGVRLPRFVASSPWGSETPEPDFSRHKW